MNKNLKKVVSTVIALALSLSSFAAMAAKSFTDVPETASYAEAVKTLASLGIINGYEDGTFKPTNNITRAEVTVMVVGALNKSAAAAGMAGTTKFDDVNNEAKKWASGYVNQGVSEGFISGYDDGTFKPENNVTYAEIVKMLVSALGYDDYATYMGGWPTGYISIGQSEGICNGVSANANDIVTRSQVSQLIYNALNTPVVLNMGMTYTTDGKIVPKIQKQDGTGDSSYYKTLLTERFKAYYVEGYVNGTSRTNSSLDADEVTLNLVKLATNKPYDNSDLVDVVESTSKSVRLNAYVGDTDAANNIFNYAKMIVQLDESSDEYTIKSYVVTSKSATVSVDADLYDSSTPDTGAVNSLTYKTSSSSSKTKTYKLASDAKLFVNGVSLGDVTNGANFQKYVANNTVGTIQLLDYKMDDTNNTVKTDDKYDVIFVTYYETAQVDSVSSNKNRIIFKDQTMTASYVELDDDSVESGDLEYTIIYNGESIKPTDLKEDDVLSILFDVSDGGTVSNSSFYEIYVSREVVEGKYTKLNTTEKYVVVGGKEYDVVLRDKSDFADMVNNVFKMTMSDEYTVYLDHFGKIFKVDTSISTAKYAVLDRFYENSAGDLTATLYMPDGTVKSPTVSSKFTTAEIDAIKKIVYVNTASTAQNNKNAIQGRVFKYKLSSTTGEVTSLEHVDTYYDSVNGTYVQSSMNLGGLKMSSLTKVIDATDYNDKQKKGASVSTSELKVASITAFVDGLDYTAYGYGDKLSDGTYPIVIVTVGASAYTDETRIALVTEEINETALKNGDQGYSIKAWYEGENKYFDISDEVEVSVKNKITTKMSDVKIGDVVFMQFDGSGNVKNIDVVFQSTAVALTGTTKSEYNAFVAAALKADAAENAMTVPTVGKKYFTTDWNSTDKDQKNVIAFGPIVDKSSSSFKIAKVLDGTNVPVNDNKGVATKFTGAYSNLDGSYKEEAGALDITVTNSTNVYIYDFSASTSGAMKNNGSMGSIAKTSISTAYKYTAIVDADAKPEDKITAYKNGATLIDWDMEVDGKPVNNTNVNFAFAKVTNGVATDVVVFLAN